MNKKLKQTLIIVGPLVIGVGLILWMNRKKKVDMDKAPQISPGQEVANAKVTAVAPPASSLFPLRNGVNNSKVKELQSLLGVTADGAFGPKTEAALVAFAGMHSVDSQADLDQLKKQAQGTTNFARSKDLYYKFQAGNESIYMITAQTAKQVVQDTYGALNPTGKAVTLPKGLVYNNTDYKITGVTKQGLLLVTITRGLLAGLYEFDPNGITLKQG